MGEELDVYQEITFATKKEDSDEICTSHELSALAAIKLFSERVHILEEDYMMNRKQVDAAIASSIVNTTLRNMLSKNSQKAIRPSDTLNFNECSRDVTSNLLVSVKDRDEFRTHFTTVPKAEMYETEKQRVAAMGIDN